ncbi:hypothetical protein [Hoeflea poritis]|uniref:Transposase n=1 Tax=Hoeflea poritis TaxID=2993659 RepID=A0ABT4VS21_9HYPH|nr:hypothetical protein [Hoeflea poritis]MDA4846818.1 hypothetical protein [Hoeflea poritis]
MHTQVHETKAASRQFVPVRMKVVDVINPHMPSRAGRFVHPNAAGIWSGRY